MTDVKIADKVYMEPRTLEYVAKILRYERPDAIIAGMGGQTGLNIAMQLKEKGARRIFIFATFGLFCNGLESMDKAYADGVFTKIFTTNLIYRTPELLKREWFREVNMCKYVAYIIDTLNHDRTISTLLDQSKKIHNLLDNFKNK